ncbi:MAG: tail fiber domain-containing protein [Bacteroidia bacterium]|nr:tail fiber domain-containing protein [Bacteroidia bacterium]
MKYLLLSLSLFLCSVLSFAQTRGISYQAVARDNSGAILDNQPINVAFLIRIGGAAGTVIYQETFATNTNDFGLINLEIGTGTPIIGTFAGIDWADDRHFLEVQFNGAAAGTQELVSVPYAKVATDMNIETLNNVSDLGAGSGEVLKWNGSEWAPATDAVNDADASTTNEIQALSLSGTTLSLSLGGGSVVLPSGGSSYTAGTGISISGSNVITNTGDTDASNDVTNTTAAGGDLGGLYPSPTVTGIRTIGVSTTAPTSGQVLKYNGSQWAPAIDDDTDADASTTNEIQALSLSGTTLSLSLGGGSVVLPTGTSTQWTTSGSNIYYNLGNVGIGDATPAATLTVGDGDKFQVIGTDGDVVFTDDNASIRFPATAIPNSPMISMFASGTQNADRMVISHSSSFPTWGLEYKDSSDVFFLRSSSGRKFAFELSSGHMGIGLEDPEWPLDIVGRMRLKSDGNLSNSPGIWFTNQANTFNRAFFGMSEPDSIIGIYSQHLGKWAIEFEVMREPRIGINIPAGSPPRAEIHVMHTNFGGSNDGVRIQNEGSNNHYWNLYTSNTTGDFEFFKQGIKRATINQTSGAYTAISDSRLKTNISSLGSVLPSVMNLQAKTYQFIEGEDRRYFSGFLAQELKEVFPQFVFYGGDDQVLYTVDYAGMSVIALKAIQEQQTEIDELRKMIEQLQQEIEKLK